MSIPLNSTGSSVGVTIGYPGGTLTVDIYNSGSANPTTKTIEITMDCPVMQSFPNPVGDELSIEVDNIQDDSDIETEIDNNIGVKKKYKLTKEKKHKVLLSDLEEGVYYLKVKVKSKKGNPIGLLAPGTWMQLVLFTEITIFNPDLKCTIVKLGYNQKRSLLFQFCNLLSETFAC